MEIKLEHLTKVFKSKDGRETIAVNNFDDVLTSGKLIGLLGPSGCGKSTTLYMISGLLEPTVGRIHFGENDVTDLSPEKRGIGLVFQNYALYPHMTVRQNIEFPLQNIKIEAPIFNKEGKQVLDEAGAPKYTLRKMNRAEIEIETKEMARLVGIGELLDRKPSELSGGQQQRVAIARALVKKPRVLLLDEPLSNLDARLRLQTREEIKRIQKETGITTIFVTHDQEEAMSISDEIILMNFGIIQQRDEPQKVYDDPNNLFVAKFLGTPPIAIYNAKVDKGVLYIGNESVYKGKDKIKDIDGDVLVGIRPEGYIPNKNGGLTVPYRFIENIGRDTALVCEHPEAQNDGFRIVLSEVKEITPNEMKFDLKPDKFYIFDRETGDRLDREGGPLPAPKVWTGSLAEIEAAKKKAKKEKKQAAKKGHEYEEEDLAKAYIEEHKKEVAEQKQEIAPKEIVEEKVVLEEDETAEEKNVESEENKQPVEKKSVAKAPEKKETSKSSAPHYHVSQNKDKRSDSVGEWRVRKAGSTKTIKFFPTQKEAIDYAEELAKKANVSVVIHKTDGTIRRKNYSKKGE